MFSKIFIFVLIIYSIGMFSKACEYGIRALIFISSKSILGERVNITMISESIDSPTAFTAKVLQKLVRAGIVSSVKGPKGGFFINEESLNRTTLREIVHVIDGDRVYNSCGLGLNDCDALKPCPLHDQFKIVRDNLKELLESTTIKSLSNNLGDGLSVLKN